jgi:acyl transferase domain-containing protein
VFVEHGPRATCSTWIGQILGDRDHVALALDSRDGNAVKQLTVATVELLAAGVPVAASRLFDRLYQPEAAGTRPPPEPGLYHPHPPAAVPMAAAQTMPPAPARPPADHPPVAPARPEPVGVPPAGVAPDMILALAADQERTRSAHEHFLAAGAEAHQRFLRSQQRAVAPSAECVAFGGERPTRPRSVPTAPPRTPAALAQVAVVDGVRFDEASMLA